MAAKVHKNCLQHYFKLYKVTYLLSGISNSVFTSETAQMNHKNEGFPWQDLNPWSSASIALDHLATQHKTGLKDALNSRTFYRPEILSSTIFIESQFFIAADRQKLGLINLQMRLSLSLSLSSANPKATTIMPASRGVIAFSRKLNFFPLLHLSLWQHKYLLFFSLWNKSLFWFIIAVVVVANVVVTVAAVDSFHNLKSKKTFVSLIRLEKIFFGD